MDKSQQQLIIDRLDIIDVFNRYATGVDKRNREIYRSCFTDELDVNITGETIRQTADAWIDQAFSSLASFAKTQHIITNHSVNISGDEAEAVAYLQAHHFNEGSKWSVWGDYSNTFIRTSEGWRINSLRLAMEWHEVS